MPTFLHTADIHLDSAFSARFDAECAAQRRHELIRVVSDMADIAKELDIWLIAGDLFDGKNVSAETVAFLKRRFSEMPDTQIFIAAGNHDAFGENSYTHAKDLETMSTFFQPRANASSFQSLTPVYSGQVFRILSAEKD